MTKPSATRAYAKNLRKHLQQRFPNFGLNHKVVVLGNFLDPHLKGVHIEKAGKMSDTLEVVKQMISKYNLPQNEDKSDHGDSEDIDEVEMTATQKLLSVVEAEPLSRVFDEEQTSGQRGIGHL